jgi:hypothetical protein
MANNGISDPVTSILSAIESVREEIVGLRADLAGPSAPANVPVAAVAGQVSRSMAPTSWVLFVNRLRSLLASAGYNGRALGVEAQQFAASLKDEEADLSAWSDEEILARRAAWSPPGVVSGTTVGKSWVKARKNPWQGMSEESRAEKIAKMKAARAEKKELKTAAGEGLPAPPAAQAPGGFQSVMLDGKRYLVNMETGHAYDRQANGSQGEWAGIFSKTPKPHINTSVPKPLGGGKRKSTRKHKRRHAKTRKH